MFSSTVGVSGERVDVPYSKEGIDVFAVYCEKTDSVYWVPVEETGNSEFCLRVEETSKYAPHLG